MYGALSDRFRKGEGSSWDQVFKINESSHNFAHKKVGRNFVQAFQLLFFFTTLVFPVPSIVGHTYCDVTSGLPLSFHSAG